MAYTVEFHPDAARDFDAVVEIVAIGKREKADAYRIAFERLSRH